MRHPLLRPWLGASIALAVIPCAHADFTETSASRSVSARSQAGNFGSEDDDNPADISDSGTSGAFNNTLATSATGPPGHTTATGDTTQNTTLANGVYSGTVTAAATATNDGSGQVADGYADATFSVSFSLDVATTVRVAGSVSLSDSGSGASGLVSVLLLGDVTEVVIQSTTDTTSNFSEQYDLEAGNYTLTVQAQSTANKTFSSGSATHAASVSFACSAVVPITVGPGSAGACGGADCDYQAIQQAVDAAVSGDTIIVYRRTDHAANNHCYNEHLIIGTAGLTISGSSTTPASAACIAPSTAGDGVRITASDVTLQNLHISGKANNGAGGTNNKGAGGRAAGHGVHVDGQDIDGVVIQNCTLDFNAHDNIRFNGDRDNDGDGYIEIKQCYLHHADSMRNIRIIGGGGSSADCHIIRNNLVHTGQGILVSGDVDYVTIDRNVIKGWPYWGHLGGGFPELRTGGFGGGWRYYSNCVAGVWVTASAPTNLIVQNNLIIGTRVGVRVNTSATIRNNTIVNPFNASKYDFDGALLANDIRDQTFGVMIADGFSGTIQNNLIAVTPDNRATGHPGQAAGTYYTTGITGYGIAFQGDAGTLGGGASITNNNVWGFVDADGVTATNYGSGIATGSTQLSVDPQFASDTDDEANGGSAPCLADGNEVGDTRCYVLYEDNYFLSSTQTQGSCHASVLGNTAGATDFVDLSAGGTRDPDTHYFSGLGDCVAASDSVDSRGIDFGSGAVGIEPEKNGDLINLGAFGGSDRASRSATLRIVGVDVEGGGAKDGDATFSGPGIIQPGADGLTALNVYFNRAISASSSSFLIRDHCDTTDLSAPTFDFSGSSAAPFVVRLTWSANTLENQWVRVHALGDGVDRIVDIENADALDGEVTDLEDGPLPSGNASDGGDAVFVVGALEGDSDGDAE